MGASWRRFRTDYDELGVAGERERGDPIQDSTTTHHTPPPPLTTTTPHRPCTVNKEGTATIPNVYSWNSNATVIYIDQPAGTGFSYGAGLDHDEKGVAADMYDFLQQFFIAHKEYAARDFYVFGESYAGHYVPAVTHLIWLNNKQLPSGAIKLNLKGTSVGNGLTDPSIQYDYYADMAASTNHHSPAVNKTGYELMKAATVPCLAAIDLCQTVPESCLVATDICNLALIEPYQLSGRNPYDMRIKCAVPPLCYDFSNVATYLERPEVIAALGVQGHKWSDCNHLVAIGFELGGDWMHDYQQMIPDQLASGIRVLMYAGDQDFICNWLGNQGASFYIYDIVMYTAEAEAHCNSHSDRWRHSIIINHWCATVSSPPPLSSPPQHGSRPWSGRTRPSSIKTLHRLSGASMAPRRGRCAQATGSRSSEFTTQVIK